MDKNGGSHYEKNEKNAKKTLRSQVFSCFFGFFDQGDVGTHIQDAKRPFFDRFFTIFFRFMHYLNNPSLIISQLRKDGMSRIQKSDMWFRVINLMFLTHFLVSKILHFFWPLFWYPWWFFKTPPGNFGVFWKITIFRKSWKMSKKHGHFLINFLGTFLTFPWPCRKWSTRTSTFWMTCQKCVWCIAHEIFGLKLSWSTFVIFHGRFGYFIESCGFWWFMQTDMVNFLSTIRKIYVSSRILTTDRMDCP